MVQGQDGILIYGATGYTGRLIAEEGRRRGWRPVLSGRDGPAVAEVARQLGLPYRVAALEPGGSALASALQGMAVVVHAAGPYAATGEPMVAACLQAGCHYLDLSGEVRGLEQMALRHHLPARQRGLMVMPAVGFDVVASDCLSTYLWQSLPGATRLAIGIAGLDLISRGSARTAMAQLGQEVLVRRGGRLRPVPAGSLRRSFDFGSGPRPAVAVSWADLVTAHHATGIPDIEVYYDETAVMRALQAANQLVGWTRPWMAPWMELGARLLPAGPGEAERRGRRAVVVAEVHDASGRGRRARLTTPEVYTFTARTTWAIVERVLDGEVEPGFQTPGRVYGPDLVLELEGVSREDLTALPGLPGWAAAGIFA